VHFAIVAAVFPVIFVGELPDKTMFASLLMATRGKAGAVWAGAAAAFVVHVVIATTIGVALFDLLPRRPVDGAVALMFLVGAALAAREAVKQREVAPLVTREARPGRRAASTAFFVIFLAEWGDLTQVLTADLAAHFHAPLSVGLGALLALWAVAALAVTGGQNLVRIVDIKTVRAITAAILAVLAGLATWQALRWRGFY